MLSASQGSGRPLCQSHVDLLLEQGSLTVQSPWQGFTAVGPRGFCGREHQTATLVSLISSALRAGLRGHSRILLVHLGVAADQSVPAVVLPLAPSVNPWNSQPQQLPIGELCGPIGLGLRVGDRREVLI